MPAPKTPNPLPGYRRSNRCPNCGAFADVEFRRIGTYHVDCSNCGMDERVHDDEL